MKPASSNIHLQRCLVTGASGFVGQTLCEKLQSQGIMVRALLRHQRPGPWNEVVHCNLEDFSEKMDEIFSGIDTIFYLASIAHSKASVHEYDEFNVRLCLRFSEAAIRHGVKRFIYVSSAKAMAEPYDRLVDETFADMPSHPYGLSKRRAEEGLLAAQGFEHLVILRPCLIYGKGVRGNLSSMLNWIAKGLFPPLPDTGNKRSMVSVRDVASALIACASSSVAHRQIYLVTDGVDYSVKAIENSMRLALHKSVQRWFIPQRLIRLLSRLPFFSGILHKLLGSARYSSEKLHRELAWQPTENFFQVLPEMIDDHISRKLR